MSDESAKRPHQSDKKSAYNPLDNIPPEKRSPGRPKGKQNRLTELKQHLLRDSAREKVIGVFNDMLDSPREQVRIEALKIAVSLIPREDKIQHEIAQLVLTKQVIVASCPHCGHNPNKCKALEIEVDRQNA